MSAGSGIAPSDSLKEQFKNLNDDENTSFVVLEIQDDAFVLTNQGTKAASPAEDFTNMCNLLQDKSSAYVLLRHNKKWFCMTYIPSGAKVRSKMIYASSKAALKQGLGGALFAGDYPISEKSECNLEEFLHSQKDHHDDVMSGEERMHQDTHYEVGHALGDSKVSAIVGIPIKIGDGVVGALTGLKEGSHNTLELLLDPSSETLQTCTPSTGSLSDLNYPEKEPRFFVHNFSHNQDGEDRAKLVFVYYCPMKAPARLRMMYSTSKSNVIKLMKSLELPDHHNVEVNDASEVSDELVLADLYPAAAEDRSFKKPSARGRGKATRAKFQG